MTLLRQAAAALTLALVPATFAGASPVAPKTFTSQLDMTNRQDVTGHDGVSPETAGEWQTFVEQTYLIGRGLSYSPIYDFGPAGTTVDALKSELFVARGDICSAAIYSVDIATAPAQTLATRYFPNRDGVVELPNVTVYKAVIIVQQASAYTSRCILRLSGQLHGGTDDPIPGDFAMLGALNYQGGLAQQDIHVGGAKVKQFWVRLPQFCAGLEVLEAGTITEGQYDKARLVDAAKMIFEVNGGAGARVGDIRVIFNGPHDSTCDVPVYVKSAL